MSHRKASQNATLFAKARVVYAQIAKAPLEGLRGKDPWASVVQATKDRTNRDVLKRLGELDSQEASRYSDKEFLDTLKQSANAIKAVLQLVLQEQLANMKGVKVLILHSVTSSLSNMFTARIGQAAGAQLQASTEQAAVAQVLTASGRLR